MTRDSTIGALIAGARAVIDGEARLTKADQAIGDGDHGIGMARGFSAGIRALEALSDDAAPAAAFTALGRAILTTAGGASGAVFGTLFGAAGKALDGRDLDTASLAAALRAGLDAVMARGGARPGQKTMLDALAPAVASLEADAGVGLAAALDGAAAAARQGAAATASMPAAMGRAKMLGDRALGHEDPGAITVSIFLKGVADHFAEPKG
jgi:phosphoenolpyruvate---glycerone phosphotransferase subunit DhaL